MFFQPKRASRSVIQQLLAGQQFREDVSGAWFTLTDFTEINPKYHFKISLNRLEIGTKDNWIDHANNTGNLVLT